ncbi:Malonyl-CoA decarboxylase [hydrothermal vent metagenome]|uniref:Malonyl-CoA decarboxylase n=1 Tax=hydrothermal vent metagenome TaxID=652676 RepID=A0A3B0TXW2_9ZZZZ
MARSNFLADLLGSVFERRDVWRAQDDKRPIEALSAALLSTRGEVSARKIGTALLARYERLEPDQRAAFFHHLNDVLDVDAKAIEVAAKTYAAAPSPANLEALLNVSEPRRQELLRRLNQGSDATGRIVAMRKDLLALLRREPELRRTDLDFEHLFVSWFNRGFLVLRHISWETPANILEKIIQYEAVHAIDDWEDLRGRLEPEDRRCFAFFHPAMPDEPLVFVEVALTRGTPVSIQSVLSQDRPSLSGEDADTAVFYSISNCQAGLRGISFGNSLIKQVVDDLSAALPNLKTFVTLSPVPGFAKWLARQVAENPEHPGAALLRVERGDDDLAIQLACFYLAKAKRDDGLPLDPVARFHLGNGAELHAAHGSADVSDNGRRQSLGVMVNYLYRLPRIEANHSAYAEDATVAKSSSIAGLAQRGEKLIAQAANSKPIPQEAPLRRDPHG